MLIATYSPSNTIVSDIEYYTTVYACHLCDALEFLDQTIGTYAFTGVRT